MKILKMIVELSATKILCICCNVINNSTFLQIMLHHTCQFGHAIGQTSFGNFFGELKFRIHILHISRNEKQIVTKNSCRLQFKH